MLKLPDGFVFLSEIDSTMIESVRYHGNENFLGKKVLGYNVNKIICTREAAEQLKKAHDFFKKQGYQLVIYDGYRPQMAVDEFKVWGKKGIHDVVLKKNYFPTIEKKELFKLGYLAEKTSTHSRGSTFDLSLIEKNKFLKKISYIDRQLSNGDEIIFLDDNTVDMGAGFDLFHEVSHHDNTLIKQEHIKMRNFLREGMKQVGFKEYEKEWWHYTLEKEPFPETYFNFFIYP